MKQRLDSALVTKGLVVTRSQAESWIKMGKVKVDGRVVTKPGHFVREDSDIKMSDETQYVSRAGLKLASVAETMHIDFRGKTVLDVGSSTGGFTDYALKNSARKVYAVDVGTDQLHPSLRKNPQIISMEKTDIRNVYTSAPDDKSASNYHLLHDMPDIVVIDVSFISLRDILPHIHDNLVTPATQIAAMVKPQFEAGKDQTNKGIIKNDAMRRQILKDFEMWAKQYFVILDKRDSDVAGAKGNQERFYLLQSLKNDSKNVVT